MITDEILLKFNLDQLILVVKFGQTNWQPLDLYYECDWPKPFSNMTIVTKAISLTDIFTDTSISAKISLMDMEVTDPPGLLFTDLEKFYWNHHVKNWRQFLILFRKNSHNINDFCIANVQNLFI